jgi:hypothetical protein
VKCLLIALVVALVVLGACSDEAVDSPEVAAKKTACRALEAHIYQISPQTADQFKGLDATAAQQLAESMAAKLPPEDIDECVAAEDDIIKCMSLAPDTRAVRACIPSDDMLACMARFKDHHDKLQHCGYRINDGLRQF